MAGGAFRKGTEAIRVGIFLSSCRRVAGGSFFHGELHRPGVLGPKLQLFARDFQGQYGVAATCPTSISRGKASLHQPTDSYKFLVFFLCCRSLLLRLTKPLWLGPLSKVRERWPFLGRAPEHTRHRQLVPLLLRSDRRRVSKVCSSNSKRRTLWSQELGALIASNGNICFVVRGLIAHLL